jgi:hypothetical protein
LIADAAYYAAFSDSSGANPAIPRTSRHALLAHYWRTGSPLLFETEDETVEFLGQPVPKFHHLSLASIVDALQDISSRQKWLKALAREMKRREHIDPRSEELATAFGQFTQVIVDYLAATGQKQRDEVLQEQRRFFKQTRLIQRGSDTILVLGAGISTFGIVKGILQGSPDLTSLVTLVVSTSAKLALREARKHLETRRPSYGSTIPMTRTFTPRGERYG